MLISVIHMTGSTSGSVEVMNLIMIDILNFITYFVPYLKKCSFLFLVLILQKILPAKFVIA